jgi:hypothetical protein
MNAGMPRRFYISQFGYIWSLPRDGFAALLRDGAAGKGYDLSNPEFKATELREQVAKREATRAKREGFYGLPPRLHDAITIFPLDWDVETFQRAVIALDAKDWDAFRYGV